MKVATTELVQPVSFSVSQIKVYSDLKKGEDKNITQWVQDLKFYNTVHWACDAQYIGYWRNLSSSASPRKLNYNVICVSQV